MGAVLWLAGFAVLPSAAAAQSEAGSDDASEFQLGDGSEPPPGWVTPPGPPETDRGAEPGAAAEVPDGYDPARLVDGPGRGELVAAVESLTQIIGRRTGFTFAYDDHYAFPVVGLTEADVETIEERSTGLVVPIVPVEGDRSSAVMEELAKSIDARAEGAAIVRTDLETGVITVSAAGDGTTVEELLDLARDEARTTLAAGRQTGTMSPDLEPDDLVQAGHAGSEPVEERDAFPMRSGKWVTDIAECTTGWLFLNSANHFRHSTAGHCAEGQNRTIRLHAHPWSAGAVVGYTERFYPDDWDVATFTLPSNHDGVPRVTVNWDGDYRRVLGSTGQGSGLTYCFTGRGIWLIDSVAEKCGPLNSTYVLRGNTLHCLERRTRGTDSGGPVYAMYGSDVYAAGTTTLSVWDDYLPFPDPRPTDYWNCYSNIGSVLSATGYSLVYYK